MLKKVFVTGGSGFVGRHLIRRLRQEGVSVAALARSESAANRVASLGAVPVRGDLLDVAAMQHGMRACDAVIHAAATLDEWGPKEHFWRINVEGTEACLKAAQAAQVPVFVHLGTEAIYADGHSSLVDLDESRPVPAQPLPRYPETKAAAEKRVLAANAEGFRCLSVRPRLIWGPEDTSVLAKLAEAVEKGRFVWPDQGRARTSTTHVFNLCDALLLAAERGQGGQAYFVCDEGDVSYREFFTTLLASRGLRPSDRSVPLWLAEAFARSSEFLWETLSLSSPPPAQRVMVELGAKSVILRADKAKRELGWSPKISREEGLAQLQTCGSH